MSRRAMSLAPSRRTALLVAAAAVPVAMLLSGLAVMGASYAAFSAKVTNPTDNWTAGTVAISDDDSGAAMFTATNLKPGDTGTKCIAVTSSGSLASAVKLYATAAVTGTLAPYLTVKVEIGTGGGFTSGCSGFTAASTLSNGLLSTFSSSYTSYANGIACWSPTGSGSETKVFRFTYTVDTAAPNSVQAATAGMGFTWEAQNT